MLTPSKTRNRKSNRVRKQLLSLGMVAALLICIVSFAMSISQKKIVVASFVAVPDLLIEESGEIATSPTSPVTAMVSRVESSLDHDIEKGDILVELDVEELQFDLRLLDLEIESVKVKVEGLIEKKVCNESELNSATETHIQECKIAQDDFARRVRDQETRIGRLDIKVLYAKKARDRVVNARSALAQHEIDQVVSAYHYALAELEDAKRPVEPSELELLEGRHAQILSAHRTKQTSLLNQIGQLNHELKIKNLRRTRLQAEISKSESIVSPCDGRVIAQTVRVGEYVHMNKAIGITIAPSNLPIVFEAAVSARDVVHLAVGDSAELTIDGLDDPNDRLEGTVVSIAPSTNPTLREDSKFFKATIHLQSEQNSLTKEKIKFGSTGKARIFTESTRGWISWLKQDVMRY